MLLANFYADTRAKGVFLVVIHHAEGLSAQDSNGRSDPYIVLAYAKVPSSVDYCCEFLIVGFVVWQALVLDAHCPWRS